ncbi:MAG: phosphosulfolactate synthase [Gemmatimonas sp.]|nr:phosphosulfolactate synthase [Gemmatimonas sp.]
MDPSERGFDFLPIRQRPPKPRDHGITEVRGPYYTPVGEHYLTDLLAAAGNSIDTLKFAGGSFALLPRSVLRGIIELAHRHQVRVSTGGFLERVLSYGPGFVDPYLRACRESGFDIVEVSAGFISLDIDDWVRLIERVRREGLEPRAEIGIQFGAGGDTPATELSSRGQRDPELMINDAQRLLDAGSVKLTIESEGVTENVDSWRTDVITVMVGAFGIEPLIFEAADPEVFSWYVRTFGPDVNLFVDHSQVLHLDAIRAGIWGPDTLWGRVVGLDGLSSPEDPKKAKS